MMHAPVIQKLRHAAYIDALPEAKWSELEAARFQAWLAYEMAKRLPMQPKSQINPLVYWGSVASRIEAIVASRSAR